MWSLQLLRRLARAWVAANLCLLGAFFTWTIWDSWGSGPAVVLVVFLLWDSLPLCAMLWLLRPRDRALPRSAPIQLFIMLIIAISALWTFGYVVAIYRHPTSLSALTLAGTPVLQWLAVLVAFLFWFWQRKRARKKMRGTNKTRKRGHH